MKDDTSHQRHSKLLYIIFLHLRNVIHTKSYPTRHGGLWRIQLLHTTSARIQLSCLHLHSSPHRYYPHSLEAEHADPETHDHVGPVDHMDLDEALVPRTVEYVTHVGM